MIITSIKNHIGRFKRILFSVTLFFLFMLPFSGFSQGLTCDELVQYRDVTLYEIWMKSQTKYQISNSHLRQIKKIKSDLLDESRYASSDLQFFLISLKTLSDVINDIIGAASPQGQMINLAKKSSKVSVTSVKVYRQVEKGGKYLEIATSEDVEKTLAIQTVSELGRLGSVFSFVNNLIENVNTYNDFAAYKSELRSNLETLDNSIEKYNSIVKKDLSSFVEINNYKNYVDQYLNENCGSGRSSNSSKQSKEKDDFWAGEDDMKKEKNDNNTGDFWSGGSKEQGKQVGSKETDFWSGKGTTAEEKQLIENTKPDESNQFIGNVRSRTGRVRIYCVDTGQEDGDLVRITNNGTILRDDIYLTNAGKSYWFDLKFGQNKIEILALNQGDVGANTAAFKVYDDNGNIIAEKKWNLKTGYKGELLILKL